MHLVFFTPGKQSKPTHGGYSKQCSGSGPSTSNVNRCGDADIPLSSTTDTLTKHSLALDAGSQLAASSPEKDTSLVTATTPSNSCRGQRSKPCVAFGDLPESKKEKRKRDRKDRNGESASDAQLYVRRHTIPDMTVAAYGMVICGTDELQHRYRGRIEKVKFGVPINEAFAHDIPATLLVLLLKVNKEGPLKKDIWRAPGNQAQVRKLSNIMQHGRLVNISNISVYTAASVIKVRERHSSPYSSANVCRNSSRSYQEGYSVRRTSNNFSASCNNLDEEQQRQVFCRVICSLSTPSQHLLVLLFGTFRVITDSADTFSTRMTPDAIGISVAPSLFHTCIHDQRAKLEDVMRFKLASQVISKIIQGFGYTNLFPRECYEFYARITGRTLRVDEQWHFTFQYPSNAFSERQSVTFSSMISSITAACVAAANRSYSLETLGEDPTLTPPSEHVRKASATSGVRRADSLKANGSPRAKAATKPNRMSTPVNQIYSIKEVADLGMSAKPKPLQRRDIVYTTRVLAASKPPDESPPPPPTVYMLRNPRCDSLFEDDSKLRESTSCNF
ncbi:Protein 2RSSE.1 [Aphelenchoides avenae]|nr:Protein 2RSSE.1 [Aphelenchus avenae]